MSCGQRIDNELWGSPSPYPRERLLGQLTSGVAVTVTIMFVSQDDALKIRCEIDSDIDVMLRSMAAIVVIPNAKVTSRVISRQISSMPSCVLRQACCQAVCENTLSLTNKVGKGKCGSIFQSFKLMPGAFPN
ncbi:Uncharacterized protein HZ326_24164 [Fusarium oxysporum f. sp. albedinis]|nr:Uncharacterized protein HZ326_24164 [Fusarium oxysporum f. sp. albedinis]